MVPIVLAAEGINALGINLPGLVAQLINFGILLIFFSILFKRFVFPMMDERRKRIEEGLQASDEAKTRLTETEKEVGAEMAKARQEAGALIGQAQTTASRIAEESRVQARTEAEQILERARAEIALERDNAIAELRREFADLTIIAAERVIKRSLDRSAHSELIEQVLAEAPQSGGSQN